MEAITMKLAKNKMRIACLLLVMFVMQMPGASLPAKAAENYYIVQKGDNLWSIAQKHSMTVTKLKEINGLKSNIIYPQQWLKLLPTGNSNTVYIVKPGDNLWIIGKKFNVSLMTLKQLNNLSGNIIYPNQRLLLPDHGSNHPAPVFRQLENSIFREQSNDNYTSMDLYWLARAIAAEARGEPFEGQVAVGAVILNRVKHPHFPDTAYKVIFQKSGGVHQFSPVQNGSIYREPTSEAVEAARAALAGKDPTNGALFFYNPELTSRSNWIRTRPVAKVMHNHVFTL